MTKIDIISGFLGAGKTTLIKKLLKDALAGTKVVLIENEFGEIGIDGGFLKESGIEIREMNAGCICCSLVGDFGTSLREVMAAYAPERILIEPSGVGKLSDVMRAINDASEHTEMHLNSAAAVVDASKCKVYLKNFGEFFNNQIAYAGTIILTRTDKVSEEKIAECVELLREYNKDATIITTPIAELDGKMILNTIEGTADLQKALLEEVLNADYDDEDEDEHEHHHHHDHEEDEHEHHMRRMSTSTTITMTMTRTMTRRMSTSTITTMTMTRRMSTSTITTMTMMRRMSTSTITTMTMIMRKRTASMKTATAFIIHTIIRKLTAAITIIITITTITDTMRMRSSAAGEWRLLPDLQRKISSTSSRNWRTKRNTAMSFAPRVWSPQRTAHGSTSTMFLRKRRSAPAPQM